MGGINWPGRECHVCGKPRVLLAQWKNYGHSKAALHACEDGHVWETPIPPPDYWLRQVGAVTTDTHPIPPYFVTSKGSSAAEDSA